MIWYKKHLITVDILYYMPDYSDLVQELLWQTSDIIPELPRVHKFLNHWHQNIESVIKEVLISHNAEIIKEFKQWH
jgi:uncharacterized protein Usg